MSDEARVSVPPPAPGLRDRISVILANHGLPSGYENLYGCTDEIIEAARVPLAESRTIEALRGLVEALEQTDPRGLDVLVTLDAVRDIVAEYDAVRSQPGAETTT